MDILIFYEHKAREINNACLLKVELERRGYSVKIASLYNITTSYLIQPFYFSKPKLVIMPWLYSSEEVRKLKNMFKNATFKVINLQSEQVISKKWANSGYFFPKGTARDFLHICWGKSIYDRLIKCGINERNLFLSGAISTDFNKPKFLSLMSTREDLAKKYSLNNHKKWNLFISSFTYTTLSEEEIEEIYIRTNTEKDDFLDLMRRSKKLIIYWIIEFIKSHPNNEFIYRPHPGERSDPMLLDLEKEYQNFHVLNEMSVGQWIFVCDIINTWFSTSVADAYFLGKQFSIIRPLTIPLELDSELLINLPYIENEIEFIKFNEGLVEPNTEKFINRMKSFYDYEDTYVYEKICNKVDDVIKDENNAYLLHVENKHKIKYIRSIVSYLTYFIKVSNILPFKSGVFREFEKENFLVNQYVRNYGKILRRHYES